MLKEKINCLYEKFKKWDYVDLDAYRFISKEEHQILKKFKKYSPIETEDEEKVLEEYSLVGWVYWGIKPEEGYKGYAKLTERGLTHLLVEEVLESKTRTLWHKLINFAH